MASYEFAVMDDPLIDLDDDAQVQAHFERETNLDVSQMGTKVNEVIKISFVTDFGAKRGERYFIIHKGKLLGVEE